MRPSGTRVLRRERRREWRGQPTGRRATHAVETTYGRHQRDRDWRESMRQAVAEFKAAQAAEED